MERISIVIPVYNVQNYLRQCIDSVLAQTYPCTEIILVDDGSTDESGRICDEYQKQNNNIVVIHKKNGGVSAARNKGLETATGSYIAFVDSDDTIAKNYIEKLFLGIEKNAADICCCGYTYHSEKENYIHTDFPQILEPSREYFLDCLFRGTGGTVCSKLYRREVLERWNIRFNEKYTLCEDQLFALEYCLVAKKFAVINEYGYYYNKLDSGLVSSAGIDRWYQQLDLINLMETKMQQAQISMKLVDVCIERKCKSVICTIARNVLFQGRIKTKIMLSDDKIMRRLKQLSVRGKSDMRYILPLKLKCYMLIRLAYGIK